MNGCDANTVEADLVPHTRLLVARIADDNPVISPEQRRCSDLGDSVQNVGQRNNILLLVHNGPLETVNPWNQWDMSGRPGEDEVSLLVFKLNLG